MRFVAALGLLALILSPMLIHYAIFHSQHPLLPVLLLALQLGGIGLALLFRAKSKWVRLLAPLLLVVILGLAWRFGAEAVAVSSGLTHAAIHLSLAYLFGQSLRSGHEPLVTGFIRRVRGALPPELLPYGRQVTILWCAASLAQIGTSLLLLAVAPLSVWSFFINVLSFPLVLVLFFGEIAYHTIRFRHLPRSSVKDLIKMLARWRMMGTSEKPVTG